MGEKMPCKRRKKNMFQYSERKEDGEEEGGLSRKLWSGAKFHPVERDLTQEEREAKMDINTERKTEKD